MKTNFDQDQNTVFDSFNPPPGWNYEATAAQVEAIITQIETGELDLAEVFDQFTAAVEYLRQCEIFLAERQQRMALLIENLADSEAF